MWKNEEDDEADTRKSRKELIARQMMKKIQHEDSSSVGMRRQEAVKTLDNRNNSPTESRQKLSIMKKKNWDRHNSSMEEIPADRLERGEAKSNRLTIPASTRNGRHQTEASLINNGTPAGIRVSSMPRHDSIISRKDSNGADSILLPKINSRNVSPRPVVISKQEATEMNYLLRPTRQKDPNLYILKALAALENPTIERRGSQLDGLTKNYMKANDLETRAKEQMSGRFIFNGTAVQRGYYLGGDPIKPKNYDRPPIEKME